MMGRLLEELKKFLPKQGAPFDPAVFDDSVALKTEWGPLKGGGTNIRTHALKQTVEGRCEFRPSLAFLFFCGVFLLIGLGIDAAFIYILISGSKPMPFHEGLFLILFGLVFACVGGAMLYFGARPVVFDKSTGGVWKGWREPRSDFEHGRETTGYLCRLDEIHALQLVSEFVRGNKSSYTSYELNLVRVDGSRLNVVDHGDIRQLRKDVALLGEYLEVPVWDSTRPGEGQGT